MKLKCQNKKCGYGWLYNGKEKFYATCPKCLYKVKIMEVKNDRRKKRN